MEGAEDVAERSWTEEQRCILDFCCQSDIPRDGRVMRITAGAGSGKTTTLEGIGEKMAKRGHKGQIYYLTFNRSSAADAQKRLGGDCICSTLHSMAFNVLDIKEEGFKIINEPQVEQIISSACNEDLHDFFSRVEKEDMNLVKKIATTFIRRTLETFMQSDRSEEEGFDHRVFGTTYYPAVLWHQGKKDPKVGNIPSRPGDFYTKQAKKVWDLISPVRVGGAKSSKVTAFDAVVKAAQLKNKRIPGTVLLVDEAQDMNSCNIDWLNKNRPKKLVVFVGDAVQTIYGFRGAKSKFLLELEDVENASLTRSFRFGPEVACVANTILFAKEYSPQKTMWRPYRLTGAGTAPGIIRSTPSTKTQRRTILAAANVTLLKEALQLLEIDPDLRFALQGKGETSGAGKWKYLLREFKSIFSVYLDGQEKAVSIKTKLITGNYTWTEFISEVETRELTQLSTHVSLINKYQTEAANVLLKFKQSVLDKNYSLDEADIILSTVHAAKGLEWDVVEVLDDLSQNLSQFSFSSQTSGFQSASIAASSSAPEWNFKSWGDDVNLWYVALTRPKRELILPAKFIDLLNAFEEVVDIAELAETDPKKASSKEYTLGNNNEDTYSLKQVLSIHENLYQKWKEESEEMLPSGIQLIHPDVDSDDKQDGAESTTSQHGDATQGMSPPQPKKRKRTRASSSSSPF